MWAPHYPNGIGRVVGGVGGAIYTLDHNFGVIKGTILGDSF